MYAMVRISVGDRVCLPRSRLLKYERGTDAEPWPAILGLVGMVDCLLESVLVGDFEPRKEVFIFTAAPNNVLLASCNSHFTAVPYHVFSVGSHEAIATNN